MGLHPSALAHSIGRQDIEYAVEHAITTIATGNGPTRLLILGPDATGRLLEVSCVIRKEDLLYFHAAPMRPTYKVLLDEQPEPTPDEVIATESHS